MKEKYYPEVKISSFAFVCCHTLVLMLLSYFITLNQQTSAKQYTGNSIPGNRG